jgi:hypothetical protein
MLFGVQDSEEITIFYCFVDARQFLIYDASSADVQVPYF